MGADPGWVHYLTLIIALKGATQRRLMVTGLETNTRTTGHLGGKTKSRSAVHSPWVIAPSVPAPTHLLNPFLLNLQSLGQGEGDGKLGAEDAEGKKHDGPCTPEADRHPDNSRV